MARARWARSRSLSEWMEVFGRDWRGSKQKKTRTRKNREGEGDETLRREKLYFVSEQRAAERIIRGRNKGGSCASFFSFFLEK